MSQKRERDKSLGIWDLILFTFCAVFIVDTVPASAAIGVSSITWWIIMAVMFFLPYGLITAELGSTYPEQGGVYVWVKRAWGDKWGARTSWLYWVNVALWMPSVYIAFAGIFSQMFLPDMPMWGLVLIGITMTWVTVWFNIQHLSLSKWIPNIGAVTKLVVVLALIGATIYYLASGQNFANDFSASSFAPTLGTGLAFLPAIVYNMCGFELMSGAAGEMKNPKHDIPKAVIISAVLITATYLLSTFSILATVPTENVNLIAGILDTLEVVFGDSGLGGAMVVFLGICILFTFLANMVTWTIGANRTAVEAADSGELPKLFGKLTQKAQAPLGAAILTGLVSTTVFILYGFLATNAEDLFWTIFAFSGIVFLMPYAIIFPVFIHLRMKDKDIERPYKVPGPSWWVYTLAVVAELFILQGIVLFAWVPGEAIDWAYTGSVIAGVVVTVIIGELLISRTSKKKIDTTTTQGPDRRGGGDHIKHAS
ncbi:APC family permease [Bacillus massilinigeriensis]|uniref:APC family permease n=1 Tax=Bacillus massilionigeriensis TaxID=1805475 RepID=UPI000A9B76EF|nr:APC family permease [Bacillus massilionigeriensis]